MARLIDRTEREAEKMQSVDIVKKYLPKVGIGFLALITACGSCTFVPAGERGIVLHFGAVSSRVMGEGLSFKLPIYESVVKMNVQVQKHEVTANAASKDLQEVTSQIALNYHVSPDEVGSLYQQLGEGYQEKIIDPSIQESVKAVTAKYTAVELITNRHVVTAEITEAVREKLKPYHIFVDQVSTKDFSFSEKFKNAIEAKQEAEQLAQKATRDLERIKTEAEQQVATARAQATSFQLQAQTLTPQMIQMEWIKKWDGKLPSVQGSNTPMIQIPAHQ